MTPYPVNGYGTIDLESDVEIKHGNLTIAGQTAPGDGILIRGGTLKLIDVTDVVIRGLRVRVGAYPCKTKNHKCNDKDALEIIDSKKIIIDRSSFSWSIDETISVADSKRVTIQSSIIGEPLKRAGHHEGSHAYCMNLKASNMVSVIDSILAFCDKRAPHVTTNGDKKPTLWLVNNLIYGFGRNATEFNDADFHDEATWMVLFGNHYLASKDQQASARPVEIEWAEKEVDKKTGKHESGENRIRLLMSGNLSVGRNGEERRDWDLVEHPKRSQSSLAINANAARRDIVETGAVPAGVESVLENVLLSTGAAAPALDPVDLRILHSIREGKGKIIDKESDVGGFPMMKKITIDPDDLDSDGDGMPDEWEEAHSLDPDDPKDGPRERDGFTNLQHYFHSLIQSL